MVLNMQNAFGKYVCYGDRVYADVTDEVELCARVEPDCGSHPSDYGCYTDEQIRAWEDEDWCFVGLVVSAYIGDTCIGEFASLGGIDVNIANNNDHLNDYARELMEESLPDVRDCLKAMANDIEDAIEALGK